MTSEKNDSGSFIWIFVLSGIFIVGFISLINWANVFESKKDIPISSHINSIKESSYLSIGAYTASGDLVKPIHRVKNINGKIYENYTEIKIEPGNQNPMFYGGSKRIQFFHPISGENINLHQLQIIGENGITSSFLSKVPSYGKSVRFKTNTTVILGVAVVQ